MRTFKKMRTLKKNVLSLICIIFIIFVLKTLDTKHENYSILDTEHKTAI